MLPASFIAAYGKEKGDVKTLPTGIRRANELGRQMVLLAAKKFEYPAEIEGASHAYGTWDK